MRGRGLLLPLFLGVFAATAFGFDPGWSPNHIWKFPVNRLSGFDDFRDFEGLTNDGTSIRAVGVTNSWLVTWSVGSGALYLFDHAFVNLRCTDESYAVLTVRDGETDEAVVSRVFTEPGRLDLTGMFRTNISLMLEIVGTNAEVYSFGLGRKKQEIAKSEDLLVLPGELFPEEEDLTIRFRLHYPATLDVLVFSPEGRLVERVAKAVQFEAGDHFLTWTADPAADLASGTYQVYFQARVPGRKPIEITRNFLFIRK